MSVQDPYLNLKAKTPSAMRRFRMLWTDRARHIVQLGFTAFILYTSVANKTASIDGTAASIDALCSFGGLETLWRYLMTGGQLLSKTHLSNLVIGVGLLIGVLVSGGAFCGWVCPFGAMQDLLTWLRAKLRIREIPVPARLDRVLRYGRYLVLAMVLYQTISTIKLWFADWDPYRTLFGLGWLFQFNLATSWFAYAVVLFVIVGSLFVERAWCRYACPLGGAISMLGNFGFLRIRRAGNECKNCRICERPCPVKLPVATANTISSNCIGCLACVQACPRQGALAVWVGPVWLDGLRSIFNRNRATRKAQGV